VSPVTVYITMDECAQCAFVLGDTRWPKKAETCRMLTTCFYITVTNSGAVVGIYRMTSLNARNMNNVK
jgi:hypothetical protein